MADEEQEALPTTAPRVAPTIAPIDVAAVVAAHQRSLLAYVSHLVGSSEPARDIVQEAFARLCEPRNVGVALPEWLFVVCRNLAIDRLRKERPMSVLDETTAGTIKTDEVLGDPPARLVRADESRRLIGLLGQLPARQQEAVRLKFQQSLSYAQIAAVMETNVNNVAALIHIGLKTLRERMS